MRDPEKKTVITSEPAAGNLMIRVSHTCKAKYICVTYKVSVDVESIILPYITGS